MLSFQLKDRIQAVKRNVNRSSADRLIGSSRSLSRDVDLFQYFLVSKYTSHACRAYQNYSRCILSFVSSRVSFLLLSSSLLFLFFLLHPHSHSNLFERIIHERVMLEMHSREEGSAAIHRVRHSLYFIFFCYLLFFFLAIIRCTAGAHIFCREAGRCKSQLYSRYFSDRNWFSNFCTSTYSYMV